MKKIKPICSCTNTEAHPVGGLCINGADGPDGLCFTCREAARSATV